MSGPAKRSFTSFVRPVAPPAAEAAQPEPPPEFRPLEARRNQIPGKGRGLMRSTGPAWSRPPAASAPTLPRAIFLALRCG